MDVSFILRRYLYNEMMENKKTVERFSSAVFFLLGCFLGKYK